MLIDENGKEINPTRVPHEKEYGPLLQRIPADSFERIRDELNRRADESRSSSGGKILTSSWMPGSDWTGTAFQPIFDVAGDRELAGKLFGIILWSVIANREDCWCFGRYEKNGVPIEGMTYFEVHR